MDTTTVKRWRSRSNITDRSHTALLLLDNLLIGTRESINADVSRSGLDRPLWRHGVGHLADLMPETKPKASPKRFKDYEPGPLRIDIEYCPQIPNGSKRRYLFVVIDPLLGKVA